MRGALARTFTDAGDELVTLGTPATLQDIAVGGMFVWARPSLWPAAALRAIFYINGTAGGFRDFSMSGSGGATGLRLLIDRDVTVFQVAATPSNTPHAAADRLCQWAVTWDINGANGDQHLYGGSDSHQLEEVTTYSARDVGSGTFTTSSNAQATTIGGFGASQGFPGAIYFVALWKYHQPTLHELRQVAKAALLRQPLRGPGLCGAWYTDASGDGRVVDLSGYGNHGTLSGTATPKAVAGLPMLGATTRRRLADVNIVPLLMHSYRRRRVA